MDVREATQSDVEAIRSVHEASIRGLGADAYDREQVVAWAEGVESADYSEVTDPGCYFVVAVTGEEDDDEVVAFGSVLFESPDAYESSVDAEVTAVYVHPSVARSGVGSAVLSTLEATARAAGVRTVGLTASKNAVAFYEAHGYERVTERDHEFSTSESTDVTGTVVEMRRTL
ncbi:GNAT family N-acetyltransferase [Haloarchaeobius sp. HRN-SO-5]|uniref:GNAT family N-acetyltransferase n=1 Tax=Haloarchaeobius sp. HRN-SO-5 TaxID=3446118 RepID=UPI003EB6AA92